MDDENERTVRELLQSLASCEQKLQECKEMIVFSDLLSNHQIRKRISCAEALVSIVKASLQCGNIRRGLYYQVVLNRVQSELLNEKERFSSLLAKRISL